MALKWEIEFTTINGNVYRWSGEYESKGKNIPRFRDLDEDETKDLPNILEEKLFLDGSVIIDRNSEDIIFDGNKTVKLSQEKSVINLLKEENLISPAYTGFQRILFSDQVESKKNPKKFNFNPVFLTKERISKKHSDINSIREADENIFTKLCLASNSAKDVMESIKEKFIDIFPFVTDIRIAPLDFEDGDDTPSILKEIPFIQLKEKNVPDWIIQPQISSGMYLP